MAANRANLSVIDLTDEELPQPKSSTPQEQKFIGSPEKKFLATPFFKEGQNVLKMRPDM